MKKYAGMVLGVLAALSLAACGQSGQQEQPVSQPDEQDSTTAEPAQEEIIADDPAREGGAAEELPQEEASDTNILIVYFSVPETDGVDTVGGASRVAVDGQVFGNNQYVAQIIQEETGGDLFRIETVQEYPGSHAPLLEFAHSEGEQNARPELATSIDNLDSYDVIFLGYPNWNSNLPMPLYTFLEEYDLSGKTIIPFVVHGGSGFSGTIQTIQQLQPNAAVMENGLSISRNDVAQARDEVVNWVAGLNLAG